jgi:DNA-binding PucR family transcriptional regulator
VAIRVSSGASEVEGLERAIGEAAATLGAPEPLVIASGAARFDVWCGSFDPPSTEALEHYEPPARVVVAFGRPGAGVAGFRRSYEEANQAARIGALTGDSKSSVTSYARVELISLLASDLPRAREFVAGQLGALAITGGTAERLRETVLAFLVSGGSPTRVAEELFIHKNTVAERIKRAEETLGRGVNESPVELEAALTLAAGLGPAVLGDRGDWI